jgi:hypothetical protein
MLLLFIILIGKTAENHNVLQSSTMLGSAAKGVFVSWDLKFRGVTSKRILSFRSIK